MTVDVDVSLKRSIFGKVRHRFFKLWKLEKRRLAVNLEGRLLLLLLAVNVFEFSKVVIINVDLHAML